MDEIAVDNSENHLERPERRTETKSIRMLLNGESGFTLVELIVVAAILGVLASLVLPAFSHFVGRAKVQRVITELRVLEKDIIAGLVENNTLPNTLADIGRGNLLDPWGNKYEYLNLANAGAPRQDFFFVDLNTDFDIYSLGPDGLTQQSISDPSSQDDIVRVNDGGWVGEGKGL